jgi:hypothetical protein
MKVFHDRAATKAQQIDPGYAEPHYNLGLAYFMSGHRDPALKEYEIFKTINPDLAKALHQKME